MMSLILLAVSVIAQNCKPDATIDDFSAARPSTLPGDNTERLFNLLNGDYGAAGATFTVQPSQKVLEITAGNADIGQPEPQANPGTAPTFNYWFAKFDTGACFDLRGYSAVQFDLESPAGTQMNFTFTQRSTDCQTRLVDSIYKPLTDYITPDGTKKTVTIPFDDFEDNLTGGKFDMAHLKDWTIVNIEPNGVVVKMSNLKLVGCTSPTATSSVATSTVRSVSTNTDTNSAADGVILSKSTFFMAAVAAWIL